jgi:hypothetical protein
MTAGTAAGDGTVVTAERSTETVAVLAGAVSYWTAQVRIPRFTLEDTGVRGSAALKGRAE